MNRVVVGVDGSEGSRRALRWALDEASLRGATLEVIHAYEPANLAALEGATSSVRAEEIVSGANEAAQALVDDMVQGIDRVETVGRAIQSDSPAKTLVEHSKDADMLVVSSRGLGSFKSLILGSVSQQCAHYAECPVVIIRSKRQ
jgi:nucleotide-binding universal stress UspA family protein